MEIGCCSNMISTKNDGTGLEWADLLVKLGYDFIELPLAPMTELTRESFGELKARIEASGLKCKVCNNFFPSAVRLTGSDVNLDQLHRYLEGAIARAADLGAHTIVFGSSRAKNVPQGFSFDAAWQQLVELLQMVDDLAGSAGITVVIEPLNRGECNIINTVEEAYRLMRDTNRQSIRLLVDYYHMVCEKDGIDSIPDIPSVIRHVHVANPVGRVYPSGSDTADYAGFIAQLVSAGYDRGISIEAYPQEIETDVIQAYGCLRDGILKAKSDRANGN